MITNLRTHLKNHKLISSFMYVANLLNSLLTILGPIVIGRLVDVFQESEDLNLRLILLGFVGFILVSTLVDYLFERIVVRFKVLVQSDVEKKVIPEIIREETASSSVQVLLSQKINLFIEQYIGTLIFLVTISLQFIFAVIYGFYISPIIIITIVGLVFLSIAVNGLFSSGIARRMEKLQNSNENVAKFIDGVMNSSIYLNIYKAVPYGSKLLRKATEERIDSSSDYNTYMAFVSGVNTFLSYITQFGIAFMSLVMAYLKYISIGDAFSVIFLMQHIVGPLNYFMSTKNKLDATKKVRSEIESYNKEAPVQENLTEPTSITLDNISIGFDEKVLLDNVNLKFEEGKKYMLLGKSGSGKTTLLNLIMKRIDPINGLLKLEKNGKSIDEQKYGFIGQTPKLLPTTIGENIALSTDYNDNEISEILSSVRLESLVNRIDENIDEMQTNVSGGERQRILLGRLFYQGNSWVLLDEFTSGLDEYNAYLLENLLLETDKTMINVTHRIHPDLISKYDEVIILGDGSVLYSGSPDELKGEIVEYYE